MARLGSILIVDDSEHCAEIMMIAFGAHADLDVSYETQPVDVLGRIDTEQPDLILLDIKMPEIDGFTLLTDLRDNGNLSPVLMCSGSAQQSDIDRAYALGCNGYLVKPTGLDGYRAMAGSIVDYWRRSELPGQLAGRRFPTE